MESRFIEHYGSDGEKYRYDTTIRDDTLAGHPVKMTSYHSVIDTRWSIPYILQVQEAEREVGHEICGAQTKDESPCKAYPMRLEEELYPEEVGRCKHHRQSLNEPVTEVIEAVSSEKALTPTQKRTLSSPLAQSLMELATDQFFMHCDSCISKHGCDEAGENNSLCIKEKRMFEILLTEMIETYDLDSIADYFTSVSVVDTMIKIIRTSAYEGQYGLIQALDSNVAQHNLQLKKLLNSTLKTLGVDRKTKITVRHKGGRVEEFAGSIAKALSTADIDEVEMKTATVKIAKKEFADEIEVRSGPPVGFDGKEIKDDEPIET